MAHIYLFSKNNTSVETRTFGSEFVSLNQCCEYIRGLQYKPRIMIIPVEDPNFICCENQSVVMNYRIPDSTIRNKINSIVYHFVSEGSSKDEWSCVRVGTDDNPS